MAQIDPSTEYVDESYEYTDIQSTDEFYIDRDDSEEQNTHNQSFKIDQVGGDWHFQGIYSHIHYASSISINKNPSRRTSSKDR